MDIPKISLVLSDVDGTLVTPAKEVTPAARQAVENLRAAGIKFAVASSRPVRGLKMLAGLNLDTPLAGFNGGRIIAPDGGIVAHLPLPDGVAERLVTLLSEMNLSVWVFAGDEWYLTDPMGPRVEHEAQSIGYGPLVVPRFDAATLAETVKIVAVGNDHDLVQQAEGRVRAGFADTVSATRSQPFYLDITAREATKGEVVKRLAQHFAIPQDEILTIGDGENDVLMFHESGYSIAMGNASDTVKAAASAVTGSNAEEGFATAMARVLAAQG